MVSVAGQYCGLAVAEAETTQRYAIGRQYSRENLEQVENRSGFHEDNQNSWKNEAQFVCCKELRNPRLFASDGKQLNKVLSDLKHKWFLLST